MAPQRSSERVVRQIGPPWTLTRGALALALLLLGQLPFVSVALPRVHAQPGAPALAEAREALERGDPEQARALAQVHVTAHPDDADGWTVLGLAAFAAEAYGDALAHFDRALAVQADAGVGQGESPAAEHERAVIGFNRAACLAALGQHAEAEAAFLSAGERLSAPMSVLASVNAGFAALDQGALARARQHLQRALALDQDGSAEPARALLADELDGARAEDPQEAAERPDTLSGPPASASDAVDAVDAARSSQAGAGATLANAGAIDAYEDAVAAYAAGDERISARLFRRARLAGLDPQREANAVAYLDALAGGLRSLGRGFGASVSLSVGFDGNAAQSGLGDAAAPLKFAQAELESAFGSVGAELGYGASLSDEVFVLGEYSFEQQAYAEADLDLFNSQDHTLELGIEHAPTGTTRYGLSGQAATTFAGLRDFEPLTLSLGPAGWITFDYGARFETMLRVSVAATSSISDAFKYLSGTRTEGSVSQAYRTGGVRVGVSARYRDEALGTQHVVVTAPPAELCVACQGIYDIPLSYRGPGLRVWSSYRVLPWLLVAARTRAEWRFHTSASGFDVVTLDGRTGVLHERKQRDRRLGGSAGLTFDLGRDFDLYAGYDLTVGSSNVDNTAGTSHALDYGNLNYVRHLLELELGVIF